MQQEAPNEEVLELSVLLPADAAEALRKDVSNEDRDCVVTASTAPAKESTASLGFDPTSLGPVAWVVLTFVGTSVAPTAQRIMRDYLWRTYQKLVKARENTGLVVRLRNGKQMTLSSDSEQDLRQLGEWISRNVKARRH